MLSRSSLAVCVLFFCACAPEGAPAPTDPGAVPEEALTSAEIEAQWIERGGFLVSPVLEAPEGATRVGALVTLRGDALVPRIEARGIEASGAPGPWRLLEATWTEGDQRVERVELGFVAYGAELRIVAGAIDDIAGITWSAVVPASEGEPALAPGDVGRASSALRAEFAAAGVIAREAWGARATRCTAGDPSKYRMAIHHTVTPSSSDPAVRLRGIQAYHMDTQGWCDIGYHFLVSLDGRVWEGRSVELLGTHVASHNTGNVGISFIGCFHTSGCSDWTPFTPPDAMIESAGSMVRLLSGMYDIPVNTDTVKGHRDHSGASTSCPGDNLHAQLDRIRALGNGPSAPQFRAEYVHQTFPLARDPFELRAGEEVLGYIEMRNTGSATWEPGATFLGTTEPRDVASPLAGPDWISPNRAATLDRTVLPGESGRFEFTVRAPLAAGDYPQFFNLVEEGVAWFSDPGQGGPVDALLQVRVSVLESAGEDAGPPSVLDAGLPPSDAGIDTPDAGPGPDRPPAVGGCGCRAAGPGGHGAALLGLALFVVLRRRRVKRPCRTPGDRRSSRA